MQAYSDTTRACEPTALPDIEVFEIGHGKFGTDASVHPQTWRRDPDMVSGFYYWSCFPGCLPYSDARGPFATEAEALADAQGGGE